MPITVVLPAPEHDIGPGFTVEVHTDITDELPVNASWVVSVGLDDNVAQQIDQVFVPATGKTQRFVLHDGTQGYQPQLNYVAQPGTQVFVQVQLVTDVGDQIDVSPSVPSHWQPTTMLWQQLQLKPSAGALTGQQAQQLTDTERRTQLLGEPANLLIQTASGPQPFTLADLFSRNTLDRLTLSEVTSGPTCDPVAFVFNEWYVGVVVRVTTIAPELTPKTPDDDWYFPDLAVLRVFRGADLKFRRGIHTPTFMTDERWEWNWNIRNVLAMLGGPPATTVRVDWRAGCCGQVFLLRFP